ncbi:hypothetical protein P6F26_03845 [Roseibacterium sp. SDUM158017]|uniref:hypothetical protein n=1 Tax=Roseicyclus salinarum TaxID=3036773 RepID=UPI00241517C5|nr:hypothetical protein [Roseibacterium sp. SDUM158017]MDG4647564.1 hypothetical protein [Roseibacterium sp. SDUM158017]
MTARAAADAGGHEAPADAVLAPRDTGAASLDAALLAAHARGDRAALIGLYGDAADAATPRAAAFYLTHAHVFALEAGDPRASVLKARLVALGADTP